MAWKRTEAQVEVKTNTEAPQKQHGETIRMLPEDWTSVMVKFKSKYGKNLQEEGAFRRRISRSSKRNSPRGCSKQSLWIRSSRNQKQRIRTARNQIRRGNTAFTSTLL